MLKKIILVCSGIVNVILLSRMRFIQPINLISKLRLLLGRSRVSGDAHARFWTRGVRLVTVPRLEHYRILELQVVPRV